jgi:hypothetical protein
LSEMSAVRPKREGLKAFTFWSPASELERFQAFAREQERSTSAEIRLSMRERMANGKKP